MSDSLDSEPKSALTRERHSTLFAYLNELLKHFSPAERMALYGFSALLAGATLILLASVNIEASTRVPARGGELALGEVGTPRFINPLLAISHIDQDIATLVYSGLTRRDQKGTLMPDLAESYDITDGGTHYIFRLRADATFHDGAPVTAEDVLFTVGLAQNPDIKSVRRADWDGVVAEAPDSRTVEFTLPHAYAPFLENTQMGILPKHLWEAVSVEEFSFHALNSEPIGSGPFIIDRVETARTGTPLAHELTPFDNFTLGAPYLARVIFRFYANDEAMREAYEDGAITSFAGVSPTFVEGLDARIERLPSTRVFGIFFNQNHASVLSDSAVREALEASINRDALVQSVLAGYGTPLFGPIPPGLLQGGESTGESTEDAVAEARAILEEGGWTFDETAGTWSKNKQTLSFALATADTPELTKTAEEVVAVWSAVGASVRVEIYPLADFNATVLRPRNYDAILFGEVIGRTLDLFAFWHSSQRNDPGLNLALYANTQADRLLAAARAETDEGKRQALYREFETLVEDDTPAIFLYAPEFISVVPERLQGTSNETLSAPAERLLNAHRWYFDVERIWDLFAPDASHY